MPNFPNRSQTYQSPYGDAQAQELRARNQEWMARQQMQQQMLEQQNQMTRAQQAQEQLQRSQSDAANFRQLTGYQPPTGQYYGGGGESLGSLLGGRLAPPSPSWAWPQPGPPTGITAGRRPRARHPKSLPSCSSSMLRG